MPARSSNSFDVSTCRPQSPRDTRVSSRAASANVFRSLAPLAVNPEIIICDEAVAALDVSIRAQILNLLKDIQSATGVGYLFISHDLSTLRFMADRVAIMYVGRIVEYGTTEEVLGATRSTLIRRPLSPPSRVSPRGAASASS